MLEDPGQGKMCGKKGCKTYSDFVVLEEMFGKNGVYLLRSTQRLGKGGDWRCSWGYKHDMIGLFGTLGF